MQNWRRHGIFWPILLIAAGLLLFFNNIGMLPGSAWEVVFRYWPLLLIVAGLDGLWRGEGYAGATVVLALGALFLLGNLGYLTLTSWDMILRLWPVLLIAVGLDVIIGRRRPWSAAIGVLTGLVVAAGVYWIILNAPLQPAATTTPVNVPLGSITSVSGSISKAAGRLDLAAGNEGNDLLTGSVALAAGENLDQESAQTGTRGSFSLASRGVATYFMQFAPVNTDNRWNLKLSNTPTYTLNVRLAAGEEHIDLTGLKIESLNVQNAVGQTEVTLPASGNFSARIQVAVGETVVYVPRGASVSIRFDRALTSTIQPSDFTISGHEVTSPAYTPGNAITLTINQAIGAINVKYLD